MCNASNRELISEVIIERVENEELFTAFDISREVQNRARRNGTPFERHRVMKDFIHEEMESYLDLEYVKTLHRINGLTANVYHPSNRSANEYVANPVENTTAETSEGYTRYGPYNEPNVNSIGGQNANGGPSIETSLPEAASFLAGAIDRAIDRGRTIPNLDTSWQIANQSDTIISLQRNYGTDVRGTLTVPAEFVKKAGFVRRSPAYIFLRNNTLEIFQGFVNGAEPIAEYTVDDYFNIRITDRVLAKLQGLIDNYHFDMIGTTIVVRKA